MKKLKLLILMAFLVIGVNSFSMHIMEGFLPVKWAAFWFVLCLPFWFLGIKKLKKLSGEDMEKKMILALAGAFIFVLSALKIPSVTGSSSHPTGVGLASILYGPFVTSSFSMAITGPLVSFGIYKLLCKKNKAVAVFLAAALGDLATYVVTSLQLALANPSTTGGVLESFLKFAAIFAVTQVPLAIIEGLLTNIIVNILDKYNDKKEKE